MNPPRFYWVLMLVSSSLVYCLCFLTDVEAASYSGRSSVLKKCHKDTCKLDEASLRFLLVGDWGGIPIWPYYTYTENAVAKGMAAVATKQRAHFQIALGDNFYYTGVSSISDMRFRRTFEDVFTSEALFSPWYVLAGNHDHHGNVTAQINYHSAKNDRWKFPNFYYSIQFELDPVDVLVEILLIDTVQLCGNIKNDPFNLFRKDNQPSGPADANAAEKQWQWLLERLKKSKAHYLFVAGHFPVWSIAEHGPTRCLVQRLDPLLKQYNVTAYFSGHDHNLQHIQTRDAGSRVVDFVGSGCGAFMDSSTANKAKIPPGSLRFFYPQPSFLRNVLGGIGFGSGGFVLVEVNRTAAQFSYHRGGSDGDLLYRFSSPPRRQVNSEHDHDEDDEEDEKKR